MRGRLKVTRRSLWSGYGARVRTPKPSCGSESDVESDRAKLAMWLCIFRSVTMRLAW